MRFLSLVGLVLRVVLELGGRVRREQRFDRAAPCAGVTPGFSLTKIWLSSGSWKWRSYAGGRDEVVGEDLLLVDELDAQLRLARLDERDRELGADLPVVRVGVVLRDRDAVGREVGEVAGDRLEVEELSARRAGRARASWLRLLSICEHADAQRRDRGDLRQLARSTSPSFGLKPVWKPGALDHVVAEDLAVDRLAERCLRRRREDRDEARRARRRSSSAVAVTDVRFGLRAAFSRASVPGHALERGKRRADRRGSPAARTAGRARRRPTNRSSAPRPTNWMPAPPNSPANSETTPSDREHAADDRAGRAAVDRPLDATSRIAAIGGTRARPGARARSPTAP